MSLRASTSVHQSLAVDTDAELGKLTTTSLEDGDLVYVKGTGQYWRLSKSSTAAMSGNVKACASGGRWFLCFIDSAGGAFSVANVSALAAIDSVNMVDGAQIYVESLRSVFTLSSTAGTPDNITIVAAYGSSKYWYRSEERALSWAYQTTWYIDPLGAGSSDENDGSTALTPLLTWAEFRRRVSDMMVDMTVNIVSSTTEILDGNFQGLNALRTLIIQGTPTVLQTLTGTTFTNPVRSGVQAMGTMSSTDLADFTPFVGYMLKAGNQYAPLLGASGGGAPYLSYWTDETGTQTLPANGTTVTILSLPTAASVRVVATDIKLWVKTLKFDTADTFSAPQIMAQVRLPKFVACDFATSLFVDCFTYFYACLLSASGVLQVSLKANFIGGGSKRALYHGLLGELSFTGFIIYGAAGVGLEVGNGSNNLPLSPVSSTGTSFGLGIFNSTGTGFKLGQGAVASMQSLFGLGNGGYGLEINYGARAWMATTPTITGTSGDLQFCGAGTAIVPLTNGVLPTSSALTTWAHWTGAFSSKAMNYGNGTVLAGA